MPGASFGHAYDPGPLGHWSAATHFPLGVSKRSPLQAHISHGARTQT